MMNKSREQKDVKCRVWKKVSHLKKKKQRPGLSNLSFLLKLFASQNGGKTKTKTWEVSCLKDTVDCRLQGEQESTSHNREEPHGKVHKMEIQNCTCKCSLWNIPCFHWLRYASEDLEPLWDAIKDYKDDLSLQEGLRCKSGHKRNKKRCPLIIWTLGPEAFKAAIYSLGCQKSISMTRGLGSSSSYSKSLKHWTFGDDLVF